LLRDVENFARENDLGDITDLLKRGALVAQDPPNFESVDGITEEEKDAIRNEVLHKWRQPRALYFTVVLCSIGAAVQYAVAGVIPLFFSMLTHITEDGTRQAQAAPIPHFLSLSALMIPLEHQMQTTTSGLSAWSMPPPTSPLLSCKRAIMHTLIPN
jgi:hypothetical protein